MATITPGSGATIISPTLEGQIMECLVFMELAESDSSKNPQIRDQVQVSWSNSTSFNASYTIAGTQAIDNTGRPSFTPTPYLTTTFSAGSGGTFKSVTVEAYLLELLTRAEIWEGNSSKNTSSASNISGQFDTNTATWTWSIFLNTTLSLSGDGTARIVAKEYLAT